MMKIWIGASILITRKQNQSFHVLKIIFLGVTEPTEGLKIWGVPSSTTRSFDGSYFDSNPPKICGGKCLLCPPISGGPWGT